MKKRERKERKRSISLGIVLFLMVGALSGCAKNAEQGEKNVVQDEKQETEAKEHERFGRGTGNHRYGRKNRESSGGDRFRIFTKAYVCDLFVYAGSG